MELLEPLAPLPWSEIVIAPIGDLQAGSPGTAWDHLSRHIERALKARAYFIGMGDFSDFLSPSNRQAFHNAGLYDTAVSLIEEWNSKHMERLEQVLKPTRGRWLAFHHGHHFLNYSDGTTTDTRLAEYLRAPYAGTSAITRLQFTDPATHRSVACHIWSHHGEGANFTRLKRVAAGFPQCDIFMQGHNTQMGADHRDIVETYGKKMKLRSRTQSFVLTGGWMRGYQAGSSYGNLPAGSYVEKAMMPPTTIGAPLIYVSPRHKEEYDGLDVRVSTGD